MTRLILLLAAVAAPLAAQTPPAATRQIRIDVSPAGQAVLKRYLGTRDPAILQQAEQLRAVAQQIDAMTGAPRIDLARLEQLMRRQEAGQAAIQRRSNDRTLAMLRALSEADRVKFMRSFRPAAAAGRPAAR